MTDDGSTGRAVEDCFVCGKDRSWPAALRIHADELGAVTHAGGEAIYHGYLFVEPRRHAPGWEDLTGEEAAHLGGLIRRSASALRAVGCEHVYAFVYGDGVPHLHVHLVGRWPGAPEAYRTVHTAAWPDAPHSSPSAIVAFTDRLRRAFAAT